jgi:hypothetical protein
MEHEYCEYCVRYSAHGMQFRCAFPHCTKSFHPICAYLYGCIFAIERKKDGGMEVKVKCRSHFTPDLKEQATQVFLRRFLCNYKNTADMKEDDFAARYEKELEKSRRDANYLEFS